MFFLEDFRGIVDDKIISEIYKKTRKFYSKELVHINSTSVGGGVAEMLSSLILLMNDAGLKAGWRTLHGNPNFFSITKKFHNALQGSNINLSEQKIKQYLETNENYSLITDFDQDLVVIHDPQPLALIKYYRKLQPWIWRCHIDISNPNPKLWEFLKTYILKYDLVIISSEKYKNTNLPVEQVIIHPAINPFSNKNKNISEQLIKKTIKKYNIPIDKPIITQISRFDKWKDPIGVIKVFNLIKEKYDCRLILCGSMATDDPEGWEIFDQVKKEAKKLILSREIILITVEDDILVNVLQRVSSVIIQKSLKEGFGLTVTEALWKETPVIASNVGGIPLQIIDGTNGFLVEPDDYNDISEKIISILKEPKMREQFGKHGKETVRNNFLITRLILDYLKLMEKLF